jgi:predicted transcriptional regulator
LSIRPNFASALYDGSKRFEYRRRRVRLATGDRVLVYESAPVSAVTGEFSVGEVRSGAPDQLVTESGVTLHGQEALYLHGAKTASMIEARNPVRWNTCTDVQAHGLAKPPVSYARVGSIS